jgi:hypothetical protein
MYFLQTHGSLSNMAPVYHIVVVRVIWTSWAHIWRLCFRFLKMGYDSTPAYRLQAKSKGKACGHALPHDVAALEPASLPREGSDIVMCHEVLDPASPLRRAPTLPCLPQHWTAPRRLRGLRCCHMSFGSGPCPASEVGSNAYMCPMAPRMPWVIEI